MFALKIRIAVFIMDCLSNFFPVLCSRCDLDVKRRSNFRKEIMIVKKRLTTDNKKNLTGSLKNRHTSRNFTQ